MNLQEFIATKKFTNNLLEYTDELEHKDVHSFIYLDNYYIFDVTFKFDYHLILENHEFENIDLSVLEQKLYDYCKDIGALDER